MMKTKPNKYPYEQWAEEFKSTGEVVLHQGIHYDCEPLTFASLIRRYFRLHDTPVSVSVYKGKVSILPKYTVSTAPHDRAKGAKYPWLKWLDGREHTLYYGVDYDCNSDTLVKTARYYSDLTKPRKTRNHTTYVKVLGHIRPDMKELLEHAASLSGNRNQDSRK